MPYPIFKVFKSLTCGLMQSVSTKTIDFFKTVRRHVEQNIENSSSGRLFSHRCRTTLVSEALESILPITETCCLRSSPWIQMDDQLKAIFSNTSGMITSTSITSRGRFSSHSSNISGSGASALSKKYSWRDMNAAVRFRGSTRLQFSNILVGMRWLERQVVGSDQHGGCHLLQNFGSRLEAGYLPHTSTIMRPATQAASLTSRATS